MQEVGGIWITFKSHDSSNCKSTPKLFSRHYCIVSPTRPLILSYSSLRSAAKRKYHYPIPYQGEREGPHPRSLGRRGITNRSSSELSASAPTPASASLISTSWAGDCETCWRWTQCMTAGNGNRRFLAALKKGTRSSWLAAALLAEPPPPSVVRDFAVRREKARGWIASIELVRLCIVETMEVD